MISWYINIIIMMIIIDIRTESMYIVITEIRKIKIKSTSLDWAP